MLVIACYNLPNSWKLNDHLNGQFFPIINCMQAYCQLNKPSKYPFSRCIYGTMLSKVVVKLEYEKFFSERLAQLRLKTGASARDMSLSMGQTQGYINKIESRQNLPSMSGFFYICDYLGVSPKEFFDLNESDPKRIKEIVKKLHQLSDQQLTAIEAVINAMLNPE